MEKRKRKKIKLSKTQRFLLNFCAFGFLSGLIVFLLLLLYYSSDLPRPEKFTERRISQPTKIMDRTGETLLYTVFGEEKREIVFLEKIPDYLQKAIIAGEDKKFYRHFGIDIEGIIRAVLANFKLGKKAQGGSTIPQQLIRNTFLSPEKTIERKVREIILSIELDFRYSKDQILEWYLNQVPFGSNAYGIQAASQTFFSKKVEELSLAESAILASLVQAPSYLSPYGQHVDELLARKDYILDRMAEENYISKEEAENTKKEELTFAKPSTPIIAPHFVIYVKKYLIEKYGEEYLKTKGLTVYTTLDIELQKRAEESVTEGAERNQSFRAFNAALVAIDPKTGEILSMVGNKDKDYFAESEPPGCTPGENCLFEAQFNVATMGLRQPGSAFKPFVYATAFENGYSDNYIVIDEETNFGIWGGKPYIPQNYDGYFRGAVTLRSALAQSLNVPSVKVLVNLAGISNSVETAKKMGISTLREAEYYGPALVLGGGEVTLLDMVSAYSVFASQGLTKKITSVLKIEDNYGRIIEYHQPDPKRVISSETAELISSILSDNTARTPIFGANSSLYINDNISVKTGTTQFYNDAWTIGFNKDIVVGVWVGNNDNSSSYNQPGVVLATPIWRDFFQSVLDR